MNDGFRYAESVGVPDAGRSLLSHLTARYAHSTGAEWAARIAGGLVIVDGRACAPETLLRSGQTVAWNRPPWEEPAAPLGFAVLHEDAAVLAVSKPAGLPTLPGAGFLEHTLLHQVRRRFPSAAPVHRLGRWTSGVVLFALGRDAARSLERAWRERRVLKVYRAVVDGRPALDSFAVEVPIGPVPHPGLGTVHAASPSGRPARSAVSVLERRGRTSLVEVRIETGRPHQIRIHMAACGHPLAGDPLYAAGGGARPGAVPGDGGYLLHALRLGLPHPATGNPFEAACPLPERWGLD